MYHELELSKVLSCHIYSLSDINRWFPPDADQREKKYKAHRQFGDRRGGVISARTYFYADEAKCDTQMETFINCIKASGESGHVSAALVGNSKGTEGVSPRSQGGPRQMDFQPSR